MYLTLDNSMILVKQLKSSMHYATNKLYDCLYDSF